MLHRRLKATADIVCFLLLVLHPNCMQIPSALSSSHRACFILSYGQSESRFVPTLDWHWAGSGFLLETGSLRSYSVLVKSEYGPRRRSSDHTAIGQLQTVSLQIRWRCPKSCLILIGMKSSERNSVVTIGSRSSIGTALVKPGPTSPWGVVALSGANV